MYEVSGIEIVVRSHEPGRGIMRVSPQGGTVMFKDVPLEGGDEQKTADRYRCDGIQLLVTLREYDVEGSELAKLFSQLGK